MTSAEATGVCEYLQWDSDFFACRIGRIRQEALTPDLLVQIERWVAQNRIDCLYLLADPQHHVTSALAQQHGLFFTDVRVGLVRSCHADEGPSDGPVVVRPASAGDVPVLRALAAANHRDSRFYHDRHFPRASCDALFAAWIDRSCSGYADQVLVSETAGEVQGYVTIHLDTADRGRIGLLGVKPAARGTGCGRALVMSALQYCRRHMVEQLSVVTQARNEHALRLYLRCGFTLSRVRVWYHWWLTPAAGRPQSARD